MTFFKRIRTKLFGSLPTLLTLVGLIAVGFWGYRNNWAIPPASTVFGAEPPHEEPWCRDHGAPEATCVICRGLKVTTTPPSERLKAGKKPGVTEPAIEEPPVINGKPRPIVQVPSASVLEVAGVKTAVAQIRTMTETIEVNAESGYDMTRYAQVASRAPGSAMLVLAQAGQHVKKGEVLALIDAAEVGKAKAEFLQAAAQLASRRAALERIKASTTAGFRNQSDLLTAEAEVKEAGIRASSARQAIGNLGLPTSTLNSDTPLSEQELQLLGIPADVADKIDPTIASSNLLPVGSPLEGMVISQNVVAGEVVDAARPLFAVADTSQLWITANVLPAQALQIQIGQEMSFTPDGWDGDPFIGKVSWISTEVDEKTRMVRVRAHLANPDGRLLAHVFGKSRIKSRSKSSALAVPEEAVQSDGASSLVFVRLNEEVYRPRVVTLGARCDGYVEVLSGLSQGDVLATTGSYYLAAQANRGKLGAGCCANE